MKFITFFVLLNISNAHSTEIKTEKNGNIKKIFLDYNDDKKIDTIETYLGNILIKKEQDLNYDGKFDETTEYAPYISENKPIETIKKSDRLIKIYRNEKLNKIITTTQIDSDGDGKYDKEITNSEALDQKRENPCKEPIDGIASILDTLSTDVNQSISKLDDGYIIMPIGYKVQKSCLDNWGAKAFPELLTKTINTGMSCLENLAKKNKQNNPGKTNGALTNAYDLKRLLKNTPVTVICNEVKNWSGVAGHASVTPDETVKSRPDIKHPFLSLNPSDPEKKLNPTIEETSEMSRTIFHEQLHNLGIRHGEGVEYPYTCETCCIPKKGQKKSEKDSACKICAGPYDMQNKKDRLNYLNDMVLFGEETYKGNLATAAIRSFQLENPGDQSAAIMAARSSGHLFSPTGIAMAKLLKSKFPTLSKEDNANLKKALVYQDEKNIKAVGPEATVLAQASIDYYYDNNPGKTMDTLEINKDKLKKIIDNNNKANQPDYDKWTNESLLKDTKSILDEVFLRGYPDHVDHASSDRAYALMKELQL